VRNRVRIIAAALALIGGTALILTGFEAWRGHGRITPGRAVREAEAALRIDPILGNPETRQAVRLGAALSIRARLRTPEALFIQGVQFEQEGDTLRAEDRYWDAVERNNKYALAWVALGLLLSRKGSTDSLIRAEEALGWAVAVEPDLARARTAHAMVLRRLGRLQEAADEARAAVELDPDEPSNRNNYGNALISLGDVEGAAREYEAAIALNPDLAMPYYNLACARCRQGRLEEALRLLDLAFRRDPAMRDGAENEPDLQPLRNMEAFQSLLEGRPLPPQPEPESPDPADREPEKAPSDGNAPAAS